MGKYYLTMNRSIINYDDAIDINHILILNRRRNVVYQVIRLVLNLNHLIFLGVGPRLSLFHSIWLSLLNFVRTLMRVQERANHGLLGWVPLLSQVVIIVEDVFYPCKGEK